MSHTRDRSTLLDLLLLSQARSVTFLKRTDGSIDFVRGWSEYVGGFGDGSEYWLGLDVLHYLTSSNHYFLMVNMSDWDGNQLWARYHSIQVGTESEAYKLTLGVYDPQSTAGNCLTTELSPLEASDGMSFTAIDRDNDNSKGNCANLFSGGGWWYNTCSNTSPTGVYLTDGQQDRNGVTWFYAYNNYYSFKTLSMSLERV